MNWKTNSLYGLVLFLVACSSMNQKNNIFQLPNGHFSMQHENVYLEIDPNLGARIISAKFDGQELLLQERSELVNWGSTFWLAPQTLWNWPPPAVIQLGAFAAGVHGKTLKLTSEIDKQFGCKVSKTFRFNEALKCLEIEYRIINEADTALEIGPWEITVVPANGAKVFFPVGNKPNGAKSNLVLARKDGIGWFDYAPLELKDAQKIYNNGKEGWLAHIKGNNLFVKSFEVVSPESLAPGQGNVEVYVSKKFEYIEMENHGRYQKIPPGDSLTYKVQWYFRKLPSEIQEDSYSKELIDFVRNVVN